MKYPIDGNVSDIIHYAITAKRFEPVERMHGGPYPVNHGHRFEIKGGISAAAVMAKNIAINNSLLQRLKEKRK